MVELRFILAVSFLFAFFGVLLLLGMPEEYAIMNVFDFTFFTAEIITVSSACVIATGLPCAVALVIWGLASLFTYIIVVEEIIKLIIFTPISVGIIYTISRLGRGGG